MKTLVRYRRSPSGIGSSRTMMAAEGKKIWMDGRLVDFADARIHGWTGYRTSSCTQGALISARNSIVRSLALLTCSPQTLPSHMAERSRMRCNSLRTTSTGTL